MHTPFTDEVDDEMPPTAERRRPGRAAPLGLAVAAILGASAVAQAEPLSLVQSLRNGEDGTTLPGSPYELEATDDQLLVLTSDLLQLFGRDAATGSLTLSDSNADFDSSTAPEEGDFTTFDSLDVLPGGLLLVNGGRRSPTLCGISPTCEVYGPQAVSTDGGQLTLETGSDVDGASQSRLAATPDGRHAYALQGAGNGAGSSIFSVAADGGTSVVETLDGNFRLDGSPSLAFGIAFTPDSGLAFVNSVMTGPDGTSRITTMRRDTTSGRLTAVAEIDAATEPGDLQGIDYTAVSPDGTTLYVSALGEDFADSGLARYAIGADGSLEQVAIDRSANAGVPGSFEVPREIAVSPNGRLVLVGNTIGNADNQESLHLFTVGDDGATTWRGFEQSNRDGLVEDDLKAIHSVSFSPDGAFVYVLAGFGDEGVVSAFAAHADSVTTIEPPPNALAAASAATTVRVFNAGPATAHGLVATIDASGPITSTDRPDDCSVEGPRAVCRIDELDAMGSVDIVVTATASAAGERRLSVLTTQYQTDLDESSNFATATLPAVDVGDGIGTDPATTAPDAGGDAGDSGDSGGGCSIASPGPRDPSLALLMLAGWFGLRARRRTAARRRVGSGRRRGVRRRRRCPCLVGG